MVRAQTFIRHFLWPFFFINPDGPHPLQIKKKPLQGPKKNFVSGFMAKKGQKRHAAGQHGELVFFCDSPNAFFKIWLHLISIT